MVSLLCSLLSASSLLAAGHQTPGTFGPFLCQPAYCLDDVIREPIEC